jgi:hypothetical protein
VVHHGQAAVVGPAVVAERLGMSVVADVGTVIKIAYPLLEVAVVEAQAVEALLA